MGQHYVLAVVVVIVAKEHSEVSAWKSIPGFAKTIMLVQTILISFLSFWIWQEYEKNSYLQAYVNGYFQGDALTYTAVGSVSFFTILVLVLFARLHRTQKELSTILTVEHVDPAHVRSSGFLDRKTEQHLIDLIRRGSSENTTEASRAVLPVAPAASQPASGTMPLLKREEQARSS